MNKKDKIITGIDIGTNTIKVVVATVPPLIDAAPTMPKIIGVGSSKADGMHNGYIVDINAVKKSINKALDNAVRSARVRPSESYLSIGGESLTGTTTLGKAYIRNSDSLIGEGDVHTSLKSALDSAEQLLINKKIIHEIPLLFAIDGERALAHPVGMQGSKLESTVMLMHALESHIDDFIEAVEGAHVEVIDVTAAPLAASFASVSTPQKMQGCILLDIGAESTDVIVFNNNTPIALGVIPLGSNAITNAIAIELKIPLSEAEHVKKSLKAPTKNVQLVVDKIIHKTTTKLFTEVKSLIKALDDAPMLPSGVLLTGGGARLEGIENVAKEVLKLPAKVVYPTTDKVNGNPEFSVAYGLCVWGANTSVEKEHFPFIKNNIKKVGSWFKKLLP